MGTEQVPSYSQGENRRKRAESKHRHYEAHRVSKSILNGLIVGMLKGNEMPKGCDIRNTPCKIIRIKKEECQQPASTSGRKEDKQKEPIPLNKPTSMSSLILWNISKALEMNPNMDLKGSLRAAKQRLDSDSHDLNTMIASHPEQQHLVCALLAWQQLGHHDADTLHRFVESKRNEIFTKCAESCTAKLKEKDHHHHHHHHHHEPQPDLTIKEKDTQHKSVHESVKSTNICCSRDPTVSKADAVDGSFGSHSTGPVVKLPVETKVIMRLDSQPAPRQSKKGQRSQENDTMSKIDAACCLDSACVDRLASLDAATKELRTRAAKLARREAERVELLERAEAAWKDLETGYQRRLLLAEEKEDDINKQIQKLIEDRNTFKNECATLAVKLKDRGDVAEKERAKLTEVEKEVCARACAKLRLSEECAKGEAALAEQQCKAAQYERDLQFKEEQARRKLVSLENEADSARALTHEAERAMRAELSALREQIGQVSNELLEEDEANVRIKAELESLRQEKMDMVEDLEGCKTMCDLRMQGRVDVLNKKKEMLNELKEQVMECRCKVPVDEAVEVKRTPSLAALCRCAPEDRLLEACSCTSLRGRLLSNLLADLFGGLQTELGGSGSQMPCQLLKCLEDKHNWDRASVVKTNLRNFFSKLLMGELDIAIATAIENYHAKWVGASCADVAKMIPEPEDDLEEGWQQRALERRAQKMATELAEQLFRERADLLEKRARDIITSGPPPCECKPPTAEAAVYSCLMPLNAPFASNAANRQTADPAAPAFWKRTSQDVTHLKQQIEDLKKESIKKEDLKLMEDKIVKIVKQASVMDNEDTTVTKDTSNYHPDSIKKDTKTLKSAKRDESPIPKIGQNKLGLARKKASDNNNLLKKSFINEKPIKQSKKPIHGQSYAVNLCLCGVQKNGNNFQTGKSTWKQKPSRDIVPHNSSIRHSKPININFPSSEIDESDSKISELCNSNCKCFHKVPSNTSIDKLLETLAKWKYDLANPQEKCIKNIKSSLSKYSKTAIKDSMRVRNQNDSKINLSTSTASNKEQVTESDIYCETHKNCRSTQLRLPATTESEYMGAVNLDKSNENICICIPDIESKKDNNQPINENGNDHIPFKCINSNPCKCKIYQEMQKDNKRSQSGQTDEQTKVEILNQVQIVQTKDTLELKHKNTSAKSSSHTSNQKEMIRRSAVSSIAHKTELFPSNCDYYIKFLGVTLDDLGSHKKTKRLMKDVDRNTEDLLTSKEKYVDNRNKLQTKLSNSFTNPNITTDANSRSALKERLKCECNTKFEEFKFFMNNLFNNNMQDNSITRKDEGLDSQSFKYAEKTIESCVCCNSFTIDDSKDLEVNTFHLLEDHLKGKLEEFKSFSCKSSCIPPEEEEKLFTAILQRVKQVISDCANEMKCNCSGNLPNDGSWNRAYGLLQEYLKIKIKRVQCLCVLNNNKDVILPDILEKVCNLIENDFQRLKDICKCKNNQETRKKSVRIEHIDLPPNELPERDTNISKTIYDIVGVQNLPGFELLSEQNSNKSMILTENISLQVPANLGMEAKSCDIMELDNKNAQTTETDAIVTDCKSNGVMYNKCDCCYNTDKEVNSDFSEMFGTNEVFVNLYTDDIKNDISVLSKNDKERELSKYLSAERLRSKNTLSDIEIIASDESKDTEHNQVIHEKALDLPYIGYTLNCTCDDALGRCVCMKSVVRANNDKIDSLWKGFLSNCNSCNQQYSYIMHGIYKKDSNHVLVNNSAMRDEVVLEVPNPTFVEINKNHINCDTEVNAQNGDDLVLKCSHGKVKTLHNTTHTNTLEESISMGTCCTNSEIPLDWFECAVPLNPEGRVSAIKLANSIYFPVPIEDYKKSFVRDTVTDTNSLNMPQTCDCDKVPICHVKMLVENIEKNLIESKCTCDSLISKVCPVHSKRVC